MAYVPNPESSLVPKLRGVHLFHFDGAPCAQRVRFALAEKGLMRGKDVPWSSDADSSLQAKEGHWTSRRVSLIKKDHLTEEYAKIHPNMVVPALVHDGQLYLESMEIIDYIDETWPQKPLKPQSGQDREAVKHLVEWGKKLHVSVRYVSFHWGLGRLAKLSRSEQETLAKLEREESREQLKAFYEKYNRDAIDLETYMIHLRALEEGYAHIDQLLSDRRSFLIGEQLTTADIIWSIKVLRIWECGYPFKKRFPHLHKWYKATSGRSAFRDGVMSHHKGLSFAFRLKALIENALGRGLGNIPRASSATIATPAEAAGRN